MGENILLFCFVSIEVSRSAHAALHIVVDNLALLWHRSGVSPSRSVSPLFSSTLSAPLGSHHALAHDIAPFSSAIPGISAVFWALLIGSLALRLWVA